VTIDSGAFELRRQDGTLVELSMATAIVDGQTQAVLTFAGSDVIAGSLADGNYTLTVRSDLVHDAFGRALDGDGDGAAAGDHSEALFRLYGDSDGDRDVDARDLLRFLGSLGRQAGDPNYLAYFDVNGDDRVGLLDLFALVGRLGTHLNP
jgi:Dockerin type I domain